jgi:hypothetical protein
MTRTDIWALWIELPNTLILQTWEHHICLERQTQESALTQAMTHHREEYDKQHTV